MLLATAAMLAVVTSAYTQGLPRQPGEITPTPEMLTKAKWIFRAICDGASLGRTYHFKGAMDIHSLVHTLTVRTVAIVLEQRYQTFVSWMKRLKITADIQMMILRTPIQGKLLS
jgi:hypothetical protein